VRHDPIDHSTKALFLSPSDLIYDFSLSRLVAARRHIFQCKRRDGTRFEVSEGGRDVLPTTYDPPLPSPWVRQPDTKSSGFASGMPQRSQNDAIAFWPYKRALTADLDNLEPSLAVELRSSTSPAPPGSRGVAWGNSPRTRPPPARDEGLERMLETSHGTVQHVVNTSSRAYRPAFESKAERLDAFRPSTPRTLGPGSFDAGPSFGRTSSPRAISARTGTLTSAFLPPRHSRAARLAQRTAATRRSPRARELEFKEAVVAWAKLSGPGAYGGDWLPSKGNGILDKHWTRRPCGVFQ
jgi:hypothetical protein